jgi:polyribonucleotide nucleotidyltransferase
MQKVTETFELYGKEYTLETGELARQAGGAVLVRQGDTVVLVTATASQKPKDHLDFFPLTVDFEERMYAAGKLPGGFIKREARPTEKATLTARMIDRPLRSAFADGFRNEVQIIATVLNADQIHQPDIISIMAASAALNIAGIPFEGPLAGVRVVRVDGEFLVNPTFDELEESDLDLLVAGSKDAVYMVEAGAYEVTEEDMLAALEFAMEAVGAFCDAQERLVAQCDVTPMDVPLHTLDDGLRDRVFSAGEADMREALHNADKHARMDAVAAVQNTFVFHRINNLIFDSLRRCFQGNICRRDNLDGDGPLSMQVIDLAGPLGQANVSHRREYNPFTPGRYQGQIE